MFRTRPPVLERLAVNFAFIVALIITGVSVLLGEDGIGGSLGPLGLVPPLLLVATVYFSIRVWRTRLEITSDNILRVRSITKWTSVDLNTMFEVRHYVQRRNRQKGGYSLVRMVGVKDNAGGALNIDVAQWAGREELIRRLHQAAAARHVPVIREHGSRRPGQGVAQPVTGPTLGGGGAGFGQIHDEVEPRR